MARTQHSIRMVLTGGGTGGHLFPAMATAQKLCEEYPESEVLFIGTVRKMDRRSLAGHGYTVKAVHCYGLKGKTVLQTVKALFFLPVSFLEALYHLICFRPQIVVGVGGYVTAPVLVAAKFLSLPTLIHEQNSIPGLANRKLGRLVDRICLSIPGSESFFPEEKTLLTGNPVRAGILALVSRMGKRAEKGDKTVLILGGSQGARTVNHLVVKAFTTHKGMRDGSIRVIHQTGTTDEQWVAAQYKKAGVQAEVSGFFRDMDRVYGEADLLVSRAGATTLAELAVLGKPAILIPYPHAADDHQMKNGEYYSQGGGAVVYGQEELSAEKLGAAIRVILTDPGRLEQMGRAMAEMGIPDAPDRIIGCCLRLLKKKK